MFKAFLLMIGAAIIFTLTYSFVKNKVKKINQTQKDIYNEYPPTFFGYVLGLCSIGLYYILILFFL